MQKKLGIVTLAAAAMMAMTPLTANAQSKPKYSSNYWSTARYVKIKSDTKALEYKVQVKDKKLNIVNKVIKHAKIKKGTQLYARNMGNGTWQVVNQQYPSNNKGVWVIKQTNTKWFSLSKEPTISKYWSNSRYATTTKEVPVFQYRVTTKNNKLNLTNKVIKKASMASGTKLYARNMGNGNWQVVNDQYPSNKQGVWLVKQSDAKWLKATKAPTISKHWNNSNYATTTQQVQTIQYGVTTKDNKLNLTDKVLQKSQIPVGTELYARNMGNGNWQISNQQYPSNKDGVWTVKQDNDKWLKQTTAPTPTHYQLYPSRFTTVSSNDIGDNYTTAYAPFGFKPISLGDNFTINPGQKVTVRFDKSNNKWVFLNNNQEYPFSSGNNYNVSPANSQLISGTNTIQSYYSPDDPQASVPQGYQPQNNQLWIQVNSDGSVLQYYFYSNQDKKNVGWYKGKVQQQDGKNTIVPQ